MPQHRLWLGRLERRYLSRVTGEAQSRHSVSCSRGGDVAPHVFILLLENLGEVASSDLAARLWGTVTWKSQAC